jgi:uncharacterized membrane protein
MDTHDPFTLDQRLSGRTRAPGVPWTQPYDAEWATEVKKGGSSHPKWPTFFSTLIVFVGLLTFIGIVLISSHDVIQFFIAATLALLVMLAMCTSVILVSLLGKR